VASQLARGRPAARLQGRSGHSARAGRRVRSAPTLALQAASERTTAVGTASVSASGQVTVGMINFHDFELFAGGIFDDPEG